MATKVRAAFPLEGQVEGESKMSDNMRTGCVACANVRMLPRGYAGSTVIQHIYTIRTAEGGGCDSWVKFRFYQICFVSDSYRAITLNLNSFRIPSKFPVPLCTEY